MKSILPILLVMAAAAAGGLVWAAVPQTDTAPAQESTGQEMMRQAARQLVHYPSLQARVRHRVALFDRKLSGNGTYHQLRNGDKLLLRYVLKMAVGNAVTTLQQINDGDRLWIRRDTPREKQLSRVDLRRVRTALAERNRADSQMLFVGGLGQLLDALERQFRFGQPRAGMLGEVPVWVLQGEWHSAAAVPTAKGQGSKPAAGQAINAADMPHVPNQVLLVLSRNESLPLFPFRIEYRRTSRDADGKLHRQSLLAMDFYEVMVGVPVDAELFNYNVGDQEVTDETESFLSRL